MNYYRSNNDYADYLFKNGDLNNNDSDSLLSYNFNMQQGGADVDNSKPNGGFPPLFECNSPTGDQEKDSEDKKKREFQSKNNKNLVSIHNILEKRRNVIPFLSSDQPDLEPVQERQKTKPKRKINYNQITFTNRQKSKPKSKSKSKSKGKGRKKSKQNRSKAKGKGRKKSKSKSKSKSKKK